VEKEEGRSQIIAGSEIDSANETDAHHLLTRLSIVSRD
jgi:hypothetical protein